MLESVQINNFQGGELVAGDTIYCWSWHVASATSNLTQSLTGQKYGLDTAHLQSTVQIKRYRPMSI